MPTHYLGHAKDGTPITRKSTRSDFTHAALACDPKYRNSLPCFSTSAAGAARNFGTFRECEVVPVAIVTPAEYRAAKS